MFKDPIKIRNVNKKEDGKMPYDYKSPAYDKRSSCFVNTGEHYGSGFRQPVGNIGVTKSTVDVLPKNGAKHFHEQED